MTPRYDENGNYIVNPPQSRIEERLRRIEAYIAKGGSGSGVTPSDDKANTATDDDIKDITDGIWGEGGSSDVSDDQGSTTPSNQDDEETADDDDIKNITDDIWPD